MKTIELIDEHEHAGRTYPPGSELSVAAEDADWLIGLKKAKPATKQSSPHASDTAASPNHSKESAA